MRAVECTAYGSSAVLRIRERPRPVPAKNEVLVRVRVTTVTAGDWRIRSLQMPAGFGAIARPIFGFSRPRQPVLGSEAAGEVVAVGSDVRTFQPGDRVLVFDGLRMGCHAEFKCARADRGIVKLPAEIDDQTAAALPFGGTTALHFLRKTRVRPGDHVLVIGASGNVGSALVQLARHLGAAVTGVCGPTNVALVRSLGAENVIDYVATPDFPASGPRFDVVFEAVGALGLAPVLALVRDGSRAALLAGSLWDTLKSLRAGRSRGITVAAGPAEERVEDLAQIVDLTRRRVFRPVIDGTYPFQNIAQAHDRVESRRKRGSVVVLVDEAAAAPSASAPL